MLINGFTIAAFNLSV